MEKRTNPSNALKKTNFIESVKKALKKDVGGVWEKVFVGGLILLIPFLFILLNYDSYFHANQDLVIPEYIDDSYDDSVEEETLNERLNSIGGTVLYLGSFDYALDLKLASPNGEGSGIFNDTLSRNFTYSEFDGANSDVSEVSPDGKNILLEFTDSIDYDHYYYAASLTGNFLKQINLDEVEGKFGKNYEVTIWGWSQDSEKLIVSAENRKDFIKEVNCCSYYDLLKYKNVIATVNIYTGKVSKLHTFYTYGINDVSFYDPDEGILAFVDSDGIHEDDDYEILSDSSHVLNVKTKKDTKFPYEYLTGMNNYGGDKTYFVSISESGRNLKVYSVYDPSKAVASIDLGGHKGTVYNRWVLWSPHNKYFAVNVDKSYDYAEAEIDYDSLRVYTKEGDLVYTGNYGISAPGTVFSPDESLLFDGNSLLDVENEVTEDVSGTISTPIYWYK